MQYWVSGKLACEFFRFVLQGRLEQARNLLKLHSEFSTDPFLSIDELLRKMPQCNTNTSAADFEFRWRHWQVEVVARIQEGEFAAFPELSYIAGLLAGQEVFIICLNLTPTRAPRPSLDVFNVNNIFFRTAWIGHQGKIVRFGTSGWLPIFFTPDLL